MCGIAGFVNYNFKKTQKKTAKKMAKSMIARGPDEEGMFFTDEAALVHRRLVVIDPDGGKQPIFYKNLVMVYNGELYNTEDIRAELLKLNHEFSGHSDTEVLIHAFSEWGTDCLKRLNGIYGFAVWDLTEKTLFMARDRMGVKPLFYFYDGSDFIFASQIKTLLCHESVKPVINDDGLKQIFLLGPGRIGESGIIRGVKSLLPGQYLFFNKDGIKTDMYWRLEAKKHEDSFSETVEKTRFLITDAIKRQLVSDVPLCTFLSGGLDSSIISQIAAKEYESKGDRLTTYSVTYTDNEKYFKKSLFQPNSDTEFIKIMADYIHSDHREVVLDNIRLAKALKDAAYARDLPGMADIDSSLLLFCREIKKDFTVALSGECADEIFGGYPWYHNKDILFEQCFPWSRSLDARKKVVKPFVIADGDEFMKDLYEKAIDIPEILELGEDEVNVRMRQMFMLNINWFMQTLLDRKDRMSMACGLEVRVPFCDHRIAEYAYNMPWEFKAAKDREKGIVRTAMEGTLPDSILWRKKSPYPKTHNPVYMEYLKKQVNKIRKDSNSLTRELIDWDGVDDLANNPGSLKSPWYGQLMGVPQIFAYIIQTDSWFKKFNIDIIR